MSLVGELDEYRLKFGAQVAHVAQGEASSVSLLTRTPTNGLSVSLSVQNFRLHNAQEKRLPLDVQLELQVPEASLTSAQVKEVCAIQHGATIYDVVQPSPIAPTGLDRFWRFWLMTAEAS